MPIKDVYSLKGKLGDFSMQSKTPQVEGKTEPRIISVKKNWKEVIDTPEFASRKDNILVALANDSKSSTELTDVLNRVDKWMANESSIYWAISQNPNASAATKLRAADLYEKSQTSGYFDKPKSSLPLSQKSEVKYSKPDLESEAKKYKSAEEFIKKEAIRKRLISEWTKINPDDTVTLYHATYNKDDIIKQWEFKWTRAAPWWMVGVDLWDNIVYFWTDKKWVQDTWSSSWTRDIIEVKVPLEYIRKPAQNELEVYFEWWLKKKWDIWIPWVKPQSTHYDKIAEMTFLTDKEKQQLLDIYNKANKSSLPMSAKGEVKYSGADGIGNYRDIPKGADNVPEYAQGLRWGGREYIIDGEKVYVNGGFENGWRDYIVQSFWVENKWKGVGTNAIKSILDKVFQNKWSTGFTQEFKVYAITPWAKWFWRKIADKFWGEMDDSTIPVLKITRADYLKNNQ